MKPKITSFLLFVSLSAVPFANPQETAAKKPAAQEKREVPLFDGLGDYSRKIATKDAKAQRYFDQGMMFMFAFNHAEAVRAFEQAAQLDPASAMPYWGIALANGINYNDPSFTPERAKISSDALAQARQKASAESPAHQALIAALSARYPDPAPKERADAEKAYSDAMKRAWKKFPNDADVGALYAESRMNLRPWDLWTQEGKPQPGTLDILRTLEAVLKLDPSHPLANHLYIHAVEASPKPGRADASADALRGKHPALGHLLHMPTHIDIRRGRWQPAVEANQLAIDADSKYRQAVPEQGFYRIYMAHNFHMLAFAATMQGQSKLALKTTRDMIAAVPKEWSAVKENAAIVDGFMMMPMEILKRFGRWDEILQEPEPAELFQIARAMWHANRGVAFAAKGRIDDARKSQAAFRAAVEKIPAETQAGNNKAADLLAVADDVLEGEILLRERKFKESIAVLERAVSREDKLRYAEPPDWFVPARHTLGAVLLLARQPEAAEKVYREDLRRWPENGWSLHGLAQSLSALGKKPQAAKAQKRFDKIWQRADVQIRASCLCAEE